MTATPKERLDKLLVDLGHCETRSQAQGLILAGKVQVNGKRVDKPGALFQGNKITILVEAPLPYVSRGGLKLEKALAEFSVKPEGRICMDVGASTGGFTDCLLQHGASKVYAIDVGYGQLDWKLRQDPRVVVLEKTNVRHLTSEQIVVPPSLAVIDVSFISLKKVLPAVCQQMQGKQTSPILDIIALLKPQFEHKDYIDDSGFKGVVKGKEQHYQIISGLLQDLDTLMKGWTLANMSFSPITGPKGNLEFLLHYHSNILGNYPSKEDLISATITKSYDALLPK